MAYLFIHRTMIIIIACLSLSMRSVNYGTVDTCSPWELKKKFLYIFYFLVNSIRNSCVCILLASYTRESHAYNIIIWLVKSYDFSSSTLENVDNIIFFVFTLRTSVLFIIYSSCIEYFQDWSKTVQFLREYL